MMVFAEQRVTDGGTLLQRLDFDYDVFGNRIEKSVTTGSTTVQRFSWDGRDIWADLDGSSSLTTRRVFGDGVNEPIARIAGSEEWYLQDRMGSVRDVVNSAGTVIAHATYDAWGLVTGSSGSTDRYLAFGYQLDAESGLYYVMARYMDPVTHLFLQQDPIYADVNGYRYAGNNPTNATDPSGLIVVVSGEARAELGRVLDDLNLGIPWVTESLGTGDGSAVIKIGRKEMHEAGKGVTARQEYNKYANALDRRIDEIKKDPKANESIILLLEALDSREERVDVTLEGGKLMLSQRKLKQGELKQLVPLLVSPEQGWGKQAEAQMAWRGLPVNGKPGAFQDLGQRKMPLLVKAYLQGMASGVLDVTPGVGQVKTSTEIICGKDLITGEKLTPEGRAISFVGLLVSLLPLGSLLKAEAKLAAKAEGTILKAEAKVAAKVEGSVLKAEAQIAAKAEGSILKTEAQTAAKAEGVILKAEAIAPSRETLARETAQKLLLTAQQNEPAISKAMQDAARQGNANLERFSTRLKTEESLARKITDRSCEGRLGRLPPQEAINQTVSKPSNVNDVIRYTVRSRSTADYYKSYEAVKKSLESQGYKEVKVANFWEKAGTPQEIPYRGINATYEGPNKQLFEVQFHTPESLALAERLHPLYEEVRAAGAALERVNELNDQMTRAWKNLPVPSR